MLVYSYFYFVEGFVSRILFNFDMNLCIPVSDCFGEVNAFREILSCAFYICPFLVLFYIFLFFALCHNYL